MPGSSRVNLLLIRCILYRDGLFMGFNHQIGPLFLRIHASLRFGGWPSWSERAHSCRIKASKADYNDDIKLYQ